MPFFDYISRAMIRRFAASARSASTTIAVGDERSEEPTERVLKQISRVAAAHQREAHGLVAPLRSASTFFSIRGFLEDSLPTAIAVLPLRGTSAGMMRRVQSAIRNPQYTI
jgi:hypothetical protein